MRDKFYLIKPKMSKSQININHKHLYISTHGLINPTCMLDHWHQKASIKTPVSILSFIYYVIMASKDWSSSYHYNSSQNIILPTWSKHSYGPS